MILHDTLNWYNESGHAHLSDRVDLTPKRRAIFLPGHGHKIAGTSRSIPDTLRQNIDPEL